MPTTVHIPDPLLKSVDRRAKALGMSRNRLVVLALEQAVSVRSGRIPAAAATRGPRGERGRGRIAHRRRAGAALEGAARPAIYVLDTNAVSALIKGSAAVVEGTRIEDFDAAIAAHALALDATLVTANLGHTIRVPGLRVENWST